MRLLHGKQDPGNGSARGGRKAGAGSARHDVAIPCTVLFGKAPHGSASHCGSHLDAGSLIAKRHAAKKREDGRWEEQEDALQPIKRNASAQNRHRRRDPAAAAVGSNAQDQCGKKPDEYRAAKQERDQPWVGAYIGKQRR